MLLTDKEKNIEVINYLQTPPTEDELKDLLRMLGIKAFELVRTKEELYTQKFSHRKLTNAQWIKALIKNPILIERPIVVKDGKAIIARPPEKVFDLL